MKTDLGSIAGNRPAAQRMAPLKRAAFVAMAIMMGLFYPASMYVYAEGTTPPPTETTTTSTETSTPETPPPPQPQPATSEQTAPAPATSDPAPTPAPQPKTQPTPGPQKPPGPDSGTYNLNPETGCYENTLYIWCPDTKQTKPKQPQNYSYNPDTKQWDTTEWRYDAPSGKYVPNTVSVAANPMTTSVPIASSAPSDRHIYDLFYDASISNTVVSTAKSGDALVSFNTTGGNALTGDALVLATLLNIVQSNTSFNGGQVATFSSDIHGDVFGDLYIDPSLVGTLQPSTAPDSDVSLNVQGSGAINNDITLDARSGNASVNNNTTAGNATSGNADAVLNLVNILNSAISSGSSFIGMLNIHGSLNGDILLPFDLINTLIAAGGSASGGSYTTEVDLSDTQSIENLVNANASSGDATVANNTKAGSATTGDASTNITILNLTGRQVIAKNSLLVFVNVLGEWVGVIMDAPAGSTSAALGGGVTQNECSACGGDLDVNAETSSKITNNVDINASSGDATVTNNTTAGNATTGDATASANILNISNSSFSLGDWFGILFINVFGKWNGSFGVDTSAGERPETSKSSGSGKTKSAKVFRFVPNGQGGHQVESAQLDDATYQAAVEKAEAAVKSAKQSGNSDSVPDGEVKEALVPNEQKTETTNPSLLLPAIGFAIGGTMLGTERLVSKRQRRKLGK